MSLLRCLEKRRRGTKEWGKGQESGQRKGGQGGDIRYSFSLSHIGLLSLLQCPELSEKEREREKEIKNRVSNSIDRGTPQRTLATPAPSPLNIKLKHNVHTSLFYWAIQQSWFARVNALCNLSCKKLREVAVHLQADF